LLNPEPATPKFIPFKIYSILSKPYLKSNITSNLSPTFTPVTFLGFPKLLLNQPVQSYPQNVAPARTLKKLKFLFASVKP